MGTVMNDIKILDTVERYIRGEMNPEERLNFENLRKTNAEIDLLVVEHTLFLQQMNRFGKRKSFKSLLNETHTNLSEQGKIDSSKLKGKAKVVYLWKRYKRVTAIAASIAGFTALLVTSTVNYISPRTDTAKVKELGMKIDVLEKNDKALNQQLNEVKTNINSKIKPGTPIKGGGTGFMIDAKGYLITNAHVVNKGKNIIVLNNKGDQFVAEIVSIDFKKDIAILKIMDADFKPYASLPYGFKKSSTDIAESIYTLGYPKNEIVYSEGYLSAKSGFNGDTLSCQLGIAVNEGNSGGPVLNNNGEVIGILSTKELQAEGVAFAVQSRFMIQTIDELKKDTAYQNIKVPSKSTLAGMDKKQQVKKIQDCVFMIRSY
jgi:S1-C subfamily serine protease